MANTVETVWSLILDPKEIRAGESAIQRLSRLIKDKLGGESTKAVDKTTEAIKDQTEALKKNEEAAKKAAGAKGGAADLAGGVGGGLGSVGRLAGAGSLVGAGEGLGMVGDIGDAVEGLTDLSGVLGQLGPAGLLAGAAIAALGVVISDFARAAQKQADELNRSINTMREVADEIAGGATSDDIQESIDQLQFRRDLETEILAESTAAYEEFVQGIRDAFGVFAPLVEGILKVIDPREEALKQQIEESNKLISDSEAKERAYNKALEKGLTSKADAKQAAEEQTKAEEQAAREKEQADKKAASEREKAANDAQRAAEQAAQKQQQIDEKRYQAAQKYSDSLIDIARKAADDARAALDNLKTTLADNTASFWQDISDLSREFQASEREETIARHEEDVQAAIDQTRALEQIRDDAMQSEQDALRQRDFLSASTIREQANKQMEDENKAFADAQADRLRAQRNEDAQQLRELDKARRDRLLALNRANTEAQQAYQRDLIAQRDARRIAEREAAVSRNRELRAASEQAQALLGIKMQQGQMELQLAQSTLNSLRGLGSTTNNNQRTVNGGINFNLTQGAGGMSMKAVQQQILGTLGTVGLA